MVLQAARDEIGRHVGHAEIIAPDPVDLGIALHRRGGELGGLRVDLGDGEILDPPCKGQVFGLVSLLLVPANWPYWTTVVSGLLSSSASTLPSDFQIM